MFKRNREVFDSELEIIEIKEPVFKVYYPAIYLSIIKNLNKKFPALEWSFCSTVKTITGTEYILSDKIYIPKQKVSNASVKYEENLDEYNVVVHRHPWKYPSGFSQTDKDCINSNFDVSLLVSDDKITNASVCIKTEFCIFQFAANAELLVHIPEVEVDTSNIKVDVFAYYKCF